MKLTTREKGQSIVEFALMFPILVMLALSAVDLGRAVSQYIEVVNAANSAAQYASVTPARAADASAVRGAACSALNGLSCSGVSSAYSADDGQGESMGMVRVMVAIPFHPLGPFMSGLTFTIRHAVTMRVAPQGA